MFELLVTHSVHIPLRLLAMAPAHGSSTTRLPHLWVSCCLLVAGTACAVTMSELDMQHMVAARAERGRVLGGRGSCKKCRDGAKLFGVGGRVGEVAFSHLHAARSVCRGHHG